VEEIELRDGRLIVLRPLQPDDAPAVERLLENLSTQSRIFRFFSAGVSTTLAARLVMNVDGQRAYGVVAISDGAVIGHGMYAALRPDAVEVGLEVADAWQGLGVGTALLRHLGRRAADAGFETVEAIVMPGNHKMLDVFDASGVPAEISNEPGVVHVRTLASAYREPAPAYREPALVTAC
jgi:predicted N-acetyltransferase YhbS